jgi:hypothetical protein
MVGTSNKDSNIQLDKVENQMNKPSSSSLEEYSKLEAKTKGNILKVALYSLN